MSLPVPHGYGSTDGRSEFNQHPAELSDHPGYASDLKAGYPHELSNPANPSGAWTPVLPELAFERCDELVLKAVFRVIGGTAADIAAGIDDPCAASIDFYLRRLRAAGAARTIGDDVARYEVTPFGRAYLANHGLDR